MDLGFYQKNKGWNFDIKKPEYILYNFMKYKKLEYKGKIYKSLSDIIEILKKEEFYWLIDSSIENADIKIENNTIIWKNGSFFEGDWYYGIFEDGNFYGNWEDGIWVGGNFGGEWQDGINLTQDIKNK